MFSNKRNFGVAHMPSHSTTKQTEERMKFMTNEKALMIKITDFLLREQLITLEEQARAAQLIRESDEL